MTTAWTLELATQKWRKALKIARRTTTLVVSKWSVPGWQDNFRGERLLLLTPFVVSARLVASPKSPLYVWKFCNQNFYDVRDNNDCQLGAKAVETLLRKWVAMDVVRRWGFTGWVQDDFPF